MIPVYWMHLVVALVALGGLGVSIGIIIYRTKKGTLNDKVAAWSFVVLFALEFAAYLASFFIEHHNYTSINNLMGDKSMPMGVVTN